MGRLDQTIKALHVAQEIQDDVDQILAPKPAQHSEVIFELERLVNARPKNDSPNVKRALVWLIGQIKAGRCEHVFTSWRE